MKRGLEFAAFRLLVGIALGDEKDFVAEIDDGGGKKAFLSKAEAVNYALDADECHIYPQGGGWLYFVWCNQVYDCLSDFSVSLEDLGDKIYAIAQKIQNGECAIVVDSK